MTVVVQYIEDRYCVYYPETKTVSYFDAVKDIGLNRNDSIVTCDQSFVLSNHQYDICLIDKIIFYKNGKNLASLYQKYFHKSPASKDVKSTCGYIYRIFVKQTGLIEDLRIKDQVKFEAGIMGTIAYLNTRLLTTKKEFLDKYKNYKPDTLMTRKEIINYCESKGYDIYDVTVGKFNLTHENLKTFGDEKIDSYISSATLQAQYNQKKQFLHDVIPVNHHQWGTITGRVTTTDPNIQGITPEIFEGNIYSFDFVAYEIMIYCHTYDIPVYREFLKSGKKDIYSFIYNKLHALGYDSDEMKAKDPQKRGTFKRMLISILYGALAHELNFILGIKDYDFGPIHKDIVYLMEIDLVLERLLKFAMTTGRFYINKTHSIGSVSPYFYNLLPEPQEITSEQIWHTMAQRESNKEKAFDYMIKERGEAIEYRKHQQAIERNALSLNIQGTGAIIIKQTAKYLLSAVKKSKLLYLRHDEVIADIHDEADIPLIVKAMQDAYKNVVGGIIIIEHKKK